MNQNHKSIQVGSSPSFKYQGSRQQHGFIYENYIISKYGLLSPTKDMYLFDALTPDGKNGVSVKTKKKGSPIELGSWFRQQKITDDFYFAVGLWESSSTKKVTEEYLLKIDGKFWNNLFPEEYNRKIYDLFEGVQHSRDYDIVWKQRMRDFLREYNSYKKSRRILINLNPKRDHKKQLRMQCSLPYNNFVELASRYKTEDFERLNV